MNSAPPFLILGHRGSPRRYPENSLASLRGAIDEGADGFETDLRCLGEGAAVLFHDHEVDGVPVERLSLAALKERICTLAAVSELEAFTGTARIVLEVKRTGWEERLLSIIEGWPNIVVSSFDHRVIRRLADHGYRGELGLVYNGALHAAGDHAERCGATWLFPHYRHVDEEMMAEAKEHGLLVVPWTPNTPADWERLAGLGCDGVITDLPREAVAWRVSRASRPPH
jgi:glycerophosphoryl diester phosphodiesterase